MLETMPIPTNARHNITTRRDEIKNQYGVSLYFPKNCLLPNNHQEMKMDGSNRSIQQVKRVVLGIVGEAKADYEAYKKRRSARRDYDASVRESMKEMEEEPLKTKPTTKTKNPFGALMDEDEDGFHMVSKKSKKSKKSKTKNSDIDQISHTDYEFPQLGSSQPTKINMAWGPGMYNPDSEYESEVKISPITTAWGDVSDDEE
jgi:hypothetical protein